MMYCCKIEMLETESIWYKREIKAKKDLLYSPELDRAGNTRNTFDPLLLVRVPNLYFGIQYSWGT